MLFDGGQWSDDVCMWLEPLEGGSDAALDLSSCHSETYAVAGGGGCDAVSANHMPWLIRGTTPPDFAKDSFSLFLTKEASATRTIRLLPLTRQSQLDLVVNRVRLCWTIECSGD
jgi:hypothetical protein